MTNPNFESELEAAECITDYFLQCKASGLTDISMMDVMLHLGCKHKDAAKYEKIHFNLAVLDNNQGLLYDTILAKFGLGSIDKLIENETKLQDTCVIIN